MSANGAATVPGQSLNLSGFSIREAGATRSRNGIGASSGASTRIPGQAGVAAQRDFFTAAFRLNLPAVLLQVSMICIVLTLYVSEVVIE